MKDLTLSDNYCPYYPRPHKYDLYGVIQHSGNLRGGHYVADAINPLNDEWYHYDDSNMTYIPKDKVHKIVSERSYILFYKKKDLMTDLDMAEEA